MHRSHRDPTPSVLALGASVRAGIAVAGLAGLWLAILWSVSLP